MATLENSLERIVNLEERIAAYVLNMQNMQATVEANFEARLAGVESAHAALYDAADQTISTLTRKVMDLEQRDIGGMTGGKGAGGQGGGKGDKSLLHPKNMLPDKLKGNDGWKSWKSDVEDYCEEMQPGMKHFLEESRKSKETIGLDNLFNMDAGMWGKKATLYRFLKRYTEGEANQVVVSVQEENGWEAWRCLHEMFEPSMAMKNAQVSFQFTSMISHRAKNAMETRAKLVEFRAKAQRVKDVTGKEVGYDHKCSVLMGILDGDTVKHIGNALKEDCDDNARNESNFRETMRIVMEYVNITGGLGKAGDSMDLGRVQEKEKEEEEAAAGEEWGGEEGEEDWGQWGQANGLGEKCFNCNGYGHYQRECPHPKGKGKGKGKGDHKGKGKGFYGPAQQWGHKGGYPAGWKGGQDPKGKGKGGKAPRDGCFNCGGAHFARDCPTGKGSKGGGAVRSLCSIREVQGKCICSRFNMTQVDAGDEVTKADAGDEVASFSECQVSGVYAQNTNAQIPVSTGLVSGFQVVKSKAARKRERQVGSLNIFREVIQEGVNSLGVGDWEELDLAVDSGATETVVNGDMLENTPTEPGLASKRGVQYEVANGVLIQNEGEKKFEAVMENGLKRNMKAQVCDVNKALLSVSRMMDAGNRVVFETVNGQKQGYIEDQGTGERMNMRYEGGMFMLKVWVQKVF